MALLGCRPVELDPANPLDAKILETTFVYEGSVRRRCRDCGAEVWLGPRQQEVEGTPLCDGIVCFRCSARHIIEGSLESGGHLGNPEPHPRRDETPPRGTKADGSRCDCRCHSTPGIRHVAACCGPPYEDRG